MDLSRHSEPNDENQVIKLHILADKYLQNDLREKCLIFLTSLINMDSIYTILDFARRQGIIYIKSWCLEYLKDNLSLHNIVGRLKFLNCNLKYKENHKEFRDQAFLFVLDNLFEIIGNANGNRQIYEDFIVRNIEVDTIPALARFLSGDLRKQRDTSKEIQESESEDEDEEESENESEDEGQPSKVQISKSLCEQCKANLKGAVFRFMQENTKTVMTSEPAAGIPAVS